VPSSVTRRWPWPSRAVAWSPPSRATSTSRWGPGNLKVVRELALARVLLDNLH